MTTFFRWWMHMLRTLRKGKWYLSIWERLFRQFAEITERSCSDTLMSKKIKKQSKLYRKVWNTFNEIMSYRILIVETRELSELRTLELRKRELQVSTPAKKKKQIFRYLCVLSISYKLLILLSIILTSLVQRRPMLSYTSRRFNKMSHLIRCKTTESCPISYSGIARN
jgi:hypothetical protein